MNVDNRHDPGLVERLPTTRFGDDATTSENDPEQQGA